MPTVADTAVSGKNALDTPAKRNPPQQHCHFSRLHRSHLLNCTTREERTQAKVKRLQDPAPLPYGFERGVGKVRAVRDVQVAQPSAARLQDLEETQTRRV